MSSTPLYIAAYDVSDPRRLRLALNIVKDYATGGQKSAYECYLTDAERRGVLRAVAEVIDDSEDRFFLLRLEPRMRPRVFGTAVQPADPDFYFVG